MTSLAGAHQKGKTQPARSNPASLPLVQRKCACGSSPGLTGQCEDCEKEKLVQRSAATETHQASTTPEVTAQMQAMRSSGEPLSNDVREFFEPRFGHDFSQVRIHTDARAADTSKALNACAYTVGRDVVFASGEYKPETSDGRRLLAHELTHVVQQENSSAGAHVATSTFNVAPADDPSEREADRVAHDVCSSNVVPGAGPHHTMSSAHTVHRQPATTPAAPAASGPVEGPCDADTQESLKSVRKDSQDMIEQARGRLNTLRGADLKQPNKDQQNALQALSRNFAIKPDNVEKHLETIRDRLGNMQTFSENTSLSSFICSKGGPCVSKADAFTRHGEGRPVIGFCQSFFTLDPFQQKDTYVHELAHATDPTVKDQAYTSQRAYGTITTETALVNADSYARLVTDLRDDLGDRARFVTLGYTTHKDSLKDCGRFTDTLTKAMAEAELANFAALRSLGEEELWKARGQMLGWFNVVVRSPSGDCKRNDALANKYLSVFNKADDLLSKSGFVLQCDATEDCKTGPASYDGKVMRICLSWDKAVSRFAYFGWPNAILQAIYAYLDGGVSFGPVPGAPKEYRGANAAAIASHMIAAQRTEASKDAVASGFCQSIAPLRPDEEKTTAAAAATRKRDRLATGAVGWPVPELQEKLQRLVQPDLVVNGVFDDATQKALIKFQVSEKLIKPEKSGQETTEPSIAEKGVADTPTWTRLFTQLPGFHGMPKGETFKIVGFRKDDEMTMLDFDQQLLPTTTNFKGLKVTELDPGGGVNTCCSGFGCRRSITGGTWPVRDDNLYGPDTVGFTLPQVERYQHGLRVSNSESCAYAIPQVMVAELPEGQYEFARALQLYLINKKEVACAKLNQKDRRGASMTIPKK